MTTPPPPAAGIAAARGGVTLLPCPFCGATAAIEPLDPFANIRLWGCICTRCHVAGRHYAKKAEAIAAWNHRQATLAAAVEPGEVAEATDKATVLSSWIDRPMIVAGFEFQSGQVTIVDILDHAARHYIELQERRAKMHDWGDPGSRGGSMCQKCGHFARESRDKQSDCSGIWGSPPIPRPQKPAAEWVPSHNAAAPPAPAEEG